MKSYLLVVLLVIILGCQKDIDRNEQLYGKWILTGGTALQKRQAFTNNQPVYLIFESAGSIQSNGWGICSSFQIEQPNELRVVNNCVDCIVVGCGNSTWYYQFTAPNKLTITFQTDDIGFFIRQ